MAEVFSNDTRTTLSSTISAGASIIPVTSNSGVPVVTTASGDYFYARIDDELFKVTDTTSLNWLATGAQQGTTASTHFANKPVYLVVTKQSILDLGTSFVTTWADRPTVTSGGKRVYSFSDSPYIIYDDGVSLTTRYKDFTVTPPPTTGWSWDNQGTATVTTSGGIITLSGGTTAGTNSRWYYRTAPGTPYVITALIEVAAPLGTRLDGGLTFRQSSSGRLVRFVYTKREGANNHQIITSKYTNSTTFSADYLNTQNLECLWFTSKVPWFLRIADDGANLIFSHSPDGINFYQFDSRSRTDWLTVSGPDQIGFVLDNTSTTANTLRLISWTQS